MKESQKRSVNLEKAARMGLVRSWKNWIARRSWGSIATAVVEVGSKSHVFGGSYHAHDRFPDRHRWHIGFVSSHLTRRVLQVPHPVLDLLWNAR